MPKEKPDASLREDVHTPDEHYTLSVTGSTVLCQAVSLVMPTIRAMKLGRCGDVGCAKEAARDRRWRTRLRPER